MKKAELGDYLLWNKKPAKIVGKTDMPQVIIEMLNDKRCPNCGEYLGKEKFCMIVSSPLFQESAEIIPTIDEWNVIDTNKH